LDPLDVALVKGYHQTDRSELMEKFGLEPVELNGDELTAVAGGFSIGGFNVSQLNSINTNSLNNSGNVFVTDSVIIAPELVINL
jgi:hypothetical protein